MTKNYKVTFTTIKGLGTINTTARNTTEAYDNAKYLLYKKGIHGFTLVSATIVKEVR